MRRRDIPKTLLASAVGSALATRTAQAQSCTLPCHPLTDAESRARVTPLDQRCEPAPVYDVHRLGVVGDGRTDDQPAIQRAFDMILEVGGALQFDGTRRYKCNAGLTLTANNQSQARRPAFINYNNCLLDFTGLTGDAVALKYGSTDLSHAHEITPMRVGNVSLLGPEENSYPVPYSLRRTRTVGVQFENCLHWTIDPHTVMAFYKGMKTLISWGLIHLNHHVRNCHIGLHLDKLSTYSTWLGCQFMQSSVGLLARGSDTISGQSFLSCRFEHSAVHVHLDADQGTGGDNPIRGLAFRDCYYESAAYDWFRLGMNYAETGDPADRGPTNTIRPVIGVSIIGGNWANNAFSPAAGSAAICFDRDNRKNAQVIGCQFDIPVSLRQRCLGRPSKSSWRTTRNQFHETDELESFEIGEGYVNVLMTSTSVTAGRIGGNIQSVVHVSNGVIDAHFHDDYSATVEYEVWGTADNRIVTMDTPNSSAGRARIVIRDYAGNPAFATHVKLRVKGRHE